LLGCGDRGVSLSKRGQHLDGQLLQAPVTSARSRRRFACTWDAASLAACLIACLPMTAPLSNRAVGGAWQDQGRLPRVQHTAVFVKHPLIFIGDSVYPLSAFKAAQFEQISDEIYRSVIDLDTDQLITLYEGDSEQDAREARLPTSSITLWASLRRRRSE
jgi:hypothetical protein